ncbi:MAG: site-specific integrase [Oscillospiraceae bacterium]|nr:site-specific integrase [Oscillospiraceae bacterium]
MKVPNPMQLPSGSWNIRMRLNGQEVSITSPTRTECIRKAEKIKADYKAGTCEHQKLPNDTTLAQAMLQYILKYEATLSPSTLRQYKSYQKTRFPDYRDLKLKDIDWQEMIDEELRLKSAKTVRNAWALVSSSLKMIHYPIPSVRLAPPEEAVVNFLQPDEITKFCACLKGKNYEIALLLGLHGLRLSEARALDWKNVDLKRNYITVKGAIVRGEDGDVLKKQNKNRTSTRSVPIMIPQLHDALAAVENKNGPVVIQTSNVLLDDTKRVCNQAGVTECTFHDLRRSFASLCYYLKIPEKQIQAWGGWKNTEVLQKVYIKLTNIGINESKDVFTRYFSENKDSF